MQEAETLVSHPAPEQPGTDSIRYWVESFLLHQRSQRASPWTLRYYQLNLDHLSWWCENEARPAITRIEDLTPNSVRAFYLYAQTAADHRWGSDNARCQVLMSPAGAHAIARATRAFLRWCYYEIPLAANPLRNVRMPRVPDLNRPKSLSDGEMVRLFEAIDKICGVEIVRLRTRAMVAVAADSGCRAEELLGMRRKVDYSKGAFSVIGKGRKQRQVYIGSFAQAELQAYIKERDKLGNKSDMLWLQDDGKAACSYYTLRNIANRLRATTGIEHFHWHTLRHRFATSSLLNGTSLPILQRQLGHTQQSTTAIYLHVLDEDVAEYRRQNSPLDLQLEKLGGPTRRPVERAEEGEERQGGRKRVNLPAPEEVLRLVQATSYREAGRQLNVSDTTVRNHLRKGGLIE